MSRYIDADSLIDELNRREIEYRADIDEVIRTAPAENVEPVRHGEWIEDEWEKWLITCSACGVQNCGAKMDKE